MASLLLLESDRATTEGCITCGCPSDIICTLLVDCGRSGVSREGHTVCERFEQDGSATMLRVLLEAIAKGLGTARAVVFARAGLRNPNASVRSMCREWLDEPETVDLPFDPCVR